MPMGFCCYAGPRCLLYEGHPSRSALGQCTTGERLPAAESRGDRLPGAASQLTSTAGRTLRRSCEALFARLELLL